jgi:hypothetical protein
MKRVDDADNDHRTWFRELFAPSVTAILMVEQSGEMYLMSIP